MAQDKVILGPLTQVTVNGTDLSTYVSDLTLNDTADDVDLTGMGEPYREHGQGIRDATVDVTFHNSYASGKVDAVVGTQYYNRTDGTIKINPDTSGTVVYTLVNKILGYSPVAGAAGAADDISVSFVNSGTAGLTRGTS